MKENGSVWDSLEVEEDIGSIDGGYSGSDLVDEGELIDLFGEDEHKKIERKPLRPVTAGRIVGMVIMGIIVSCVFFALIYGLYTKYIRFPKEQERVWEESRLYEVQSFNKEVNSLSVNIEDSYLMRELSYANGNPDREAFIKYVVGSVGYSTKVVNKKNVFGNDLIDRKTGEILTEYSWLEEDETATLQYIDYTKIEFSSESVSDLVKKVGLTSDDIDYRNKLTDLFCQYICNIPVEEIPLVSVERVPQLTWNETGYSTLISEDIYLDKALFSSNELFDCFERFSETVANVVRVKLTVSSEYASWDKLGDEAKKSTPMPAKYGQHSVSRIWCGAYFLLNEYSGNSSSGVVAQLGNGSFEQPASVDTPVITCVISEGENGEVIKQPIRLTLIEFGVSQDAINWFQQKDIQNRGYDVTSEIQYCYYVFEVTNLSKETITVTDNSSLCDANANCSGRTGIIYGLQEEVVLEPGETGIVESWSRSTELNLKYVIWGKDFERRENPVWFRVLAGDLEDESWDKGVYINDSRG